MRKWATFPLGHRQHHLCLGEHESWHPLSAAGKGPQLSSRQEKTRVQLTIACFRRLERLARVLGPLVQTRLQATTGFSTLLKLLATFYKLLAAAVGLNLAPKGAWRMP